MNEYKKLQKTNEYDEAAVEELAELLMEKRKLDTRLMYLEELLDENLELKEFIWTTREGVSLPLHKIEDDHLNNILGYIAGMGRQIPNAIKAEARKRGLTLPDTADITLNAARQVFGLPAGDSDFFDGDF